MARSIDQIQAELSSVYNPQIDQVNAQLAELPKYYTAQQQGLDQAKVNAFGDITNAASAKGMSYSGMPIAEQSKYVGTKFLPAMAQLQQQQSQQTFGLKGQLTDIYGKRMSQAQALRQSELDREEQARQAEANRQAQLQAAAMQARASARSYGGGGSRGGGGRAPSASQQLMADRASMSAQLQAATGKDGFVSPQTWADLRNRWTGAGYGSDTFNSSFRNFANMTYGGASAGGDYGLRR